MYKITDIFKKLIVDPVKADNLKYYYTRDNNSNFKTGDFSFFNEYKRFAIDVANIPADQVDSKKAEILMKEDSLFNSIVTNRINFYYIYNNNQEYIDAITNINMVLGVLKNFYTSINEQPKYFNENFEFNLDAFDDTVKESAVKRIEEIYKFETYQLPQHEESVKKILSKYNLL